ncbi:hypothetical protein N5B55_04890 [Ralstonia pickettii]|uniref:hypothetical protein n=1 Tax=Ralstonia pickettii TaxID=329 RepID=UPI00271518F3|nr:hypothetical protein [Ralstonia pickettii]WKZ86290.1 hypothetical protein N5B55_04890 [Ralstonia pickettii]
MDNSTKECRSSYCECEPGKCGSGRVDKRAEAAAELVDNFRGDTSNLIRSIEALICLNDEGALVPHGIGGLARSLLSAAAVRLGAGNVVDLIDAEFQKCGAPEADPRAYDVLCEALNCTLGKHGFQIVAADDVSEATAPAGWPAAWLEEGWNGCMNTAARALRFLADHARPTGGAQTFNAEHLMQIADELEITKRALLVGKKESV